ncbi:MAG: hypothetical protein HY718_13555, partial [Planctomycetes bacterium]|nr:hypothetical protein [Planctomycetota bacterium]
MKTALSSSALILMATGWTASAPALGQPATQPAGAVLYNGIRLPAPWPPKYDQLPPDPMPVPYLSAPPSVIPIDVGRQLFVDNFLIEQTTL